MTTSMPAGRWNELGALLIQRRTALDPEYHNRTTFSEATGLNYRVVYDIEEARRTNFGKSILAAVEVAYQLSPGFISRYIAGAELVPLQQGERAGAAPPAGGGLDMDEEFTRAFEPHLATVRDRVEVARAARPDAPRLPGSLLFPASPFSAMAWDAVMRDGHSEEEAVKLVAQYLTLRGFERAAERNGSSASTR